MSLAFDKGERYNSNSRYTYGSGVTTEQDFACTTGIRQDYQTVMYLKEKTNCRPFSVLSCVTGCRSFSGQYKTRTADYGLRTGYKTRTEVKKMRIVD